MSLTSFLKRRLLGRVLYRHPPIGLQPERLHAWLSTLDRTRDVPGAVVEVGCSVGGTAAWSLRFLENTGTTRRYVCVDTFDGFVPEQFDADEALGTAADKRAMFDGNSLALATWVVRHHGAPDVELVQGDIITLDPARLPSRIAAALVDVDLAEPVRVALERLWPRLQPGGEILVDDCPEDTDWRARHGYRAFVQAHDLPEHYVNGMGLVTRRRREGTSEDTAG